MNPHAPEAFRDNALEALDDSVLTGALDRATELFGERRARAIADVPDWQALRERARQVKEYTLANLDRQLEAFVRAIRTGGPTDPDGADGVAAVHLIETVAASVASDGARLTL